VSAKDGQPAIAPHREIGDFLGSEMGQLRGGAATDRLPPKIAGAGLGFLKNR
jgi:hypothetical protein